MSVNILTTKGSVFLGIITEIPEVRQEVVVSTGLESVVLSEKNF